MGAFTGALPDTTTSPGGHWGSSSNPLPRSAVPSASFSEPSTRTGARAARSPNRAAWRTPVVRQGTLRDAHRRPGESGTTGWGDRRSHVATFPGPGAHGSLGVVSADLGVTGVGRGAKVGAFPRQRHFQAVQLRRLHYAGNLRATTPPSPNGQAASAATTPASVSDSSAASPPHKEAPLIRSEAWAEPMAPLREVDVEEG